MEENLIIERLNEKSRRSQIKLTFQNIKNFWVKENESKVNKLRENYQALNEANTVEEISNIISSLNKDESGQIKIENIKKARFWAEKFDDNYADAAEYTKISWLRAKIMLEAFKKKEELERQEKTNNLLKKYNQISREEIDPKMANELGFNSNEFEDEKSSIKELLEISLQKEYDVSNEEEIPQYFTPGKEVETKKTAKDFRNPNMNIGLGNKNAKKIPKENEPSIILPQNLEELKQNILKAIKENDTIMVGLDVDACLTINGNIGDNNKFNEGIKVDKQTVEMLENIKKLCHEKEKKFHIFINSVAGLYTILDEKHPHKENNKQLVGRLAKLNEDKKLIQEFYHGSKYYCYEYNENGEVAELQVKEDEEQKKLGEDSKIYYKKNYNDKGKNTIVYTQVKDYLEKEEREEHKIAFLFADNDIAGHIEHTKDIIKPLAKKNTEIVALAIRSSDANLRQQAVDRTFLSSSVNDALKNLKVDFLNIKPIELNENTTKAIQEKEPELNEKEKQLVQEAIKKSKDVEIIELDDSEVEENENEKERILSFKDALSTSNEINQKKEEYKQEIELLIRIRRRMNSRENVSKKQSYIPGNNDEKKELEETNKYGQSSEIKQNNLDINPQTIKINGKKVKKTEIRKNEFFGKFENNNSNLKDHLEKNEKEYHKLTYNDNKEDRNEYMPIYKELPRDGGDPSFSPESFKLQEQEEIIFEESDENRSLLERVRQNKRLPRTEKPGRNLCPMTEEERAKYNEGKKRYEEERRVYEEEEKRENLSNIQIEDVRKVQRSRMPIQGRSLKIRGLLDTAKKIEKPNFIESILRMDPKGPINLNNYSLGKKR